MIIKLFTLFTVGLIHVSLLQGVTPESFAELEAAEKVNVLRSLQPDLLSNEEDTLQLYTLGLSSEDSKVRLSAVKASMIMMASLQSSPIDVHPEFPAPALSQFGQSLYGLLKDDNPEVRSYASRAIVFSGPANPYRERALYDVIDSIASDENKLPILEAMAVVGYTGPELSGRLMSILSNSSEFALSHSTGKVLGFLKDVDNLDGLVEIANGPSHDSKRSALLAIGAYGEDASTVIEKIRELSDNPDQSSDMRNLSRVVINAIETGVPMSTGLSAVTPRVILTERNKPIEIPSANSTVETVQISSEKSLSLDTDETEKSFQSSDGENETNIGLFVAVPIFLFLIVLLALLKKKTSSV